jgi:hypothetical protein
MLIARADGHLVRMHLERLEWRPGDSRSLAGDEARQERRFYGIRWWSAGGPTMFARIKLVDAEGRSCIYVPITQDGKVVDSQGFVLDLEDE